MVVKEYDLLVGYNNAFVPKDSKILGVFSKNDKAAIAIIVDENEGFYVNRSFIAYYSEQVLEDRKHDYIGSVNSIHVFEIYVEES